MTGTAPAHDRLPTTGSHSLFQLVRTIGRGGMSTIWEAVHPEWGRIALKKPLPGSDPRRFRQEAELLGQLEHPALVRCLGHHIGRSAEQSWLAMEYLQGPHLDDRMGQSGGALGERTTRTIAMQICSALSYCYRTQVRIGGIGTRMAAHMDIKPANVHVTFKGIGGNRVDRVRLIDFGIAHLENQVRSGEVLGQPEFVAPERLLGGAIGSHCDVFSLGVLMYHTLTGGLPFPGRNDQETISAIRSSAPRQMSGVTPELEELVLECLAKGPGDRPRSMSEIHSRLELMQGRPRRPQHKPIPRAAENPEPVHTLDSAGIRDEHPTSRPLIVLGTSLGVLALVIPLGTFIAGDAPRSFSTTLLGVIWFLLFGIGGVLCAAIGSSRRSGSRLVRTPDRSLPVPHNADTGRQIRPAPVAQRTADQNPPVALLRVTSGNGTGKEYLLYAGVNTLGRDSSCDVPLGVEDNAISRTHGRLVINSRKATLYSTGANPIMVNGQVPCAGPTLLRGRTPLCIGRTQFEYIPLA